MAKKDFKNILGENIKAARTAKGFTQQQLAKMIGLKHYQTFYAWEKGINAPSAKYLSLIAEKTETSVAELTNENPIDSVKAKSCFERTIPNVLAIRESRKRWIQNAEILIWWASELSEEIERTERWVFETFCREYHSVYGSGWQGKLTLDDIQGVIESIKEEGPK